MGHHVSTRDLVQELRGAPFVREKTEDDRRRVDDDFSASHDRAG